MVRLARRETIDPHEVVVAHICNRTVRKCFLMGQDASSGKNFDHRKVWIEQYFTAIRRQLWSRSAGFCDSLKPLSFDPAYTPGRGGDLER